MFSHFNKSGRAYMVDVSDKRHTSRIARASAAVRLNEETFELVKSGGIEKGDVLAVAQVAGIMGAKNASSLIPMCHPIALSHADIDFEFNNTLSEIKITCTVKCTGPTGVEMEALCGASAAALCIYDMCKSSQRGITIENIRLEYKTGGDSGTFERGEN